MKSNSIYSTTTINTAIKRGEQYLISQLSNGHWKGFPTLAGESDLWVTGFITAHLQSFSGSGDWLQQVQQYLLANRHSSEGWSYSKLVPPDADSTSWCMMALFNSVAFNSTLHQQSSTFLWSHFSNNGISTYRADSGIDTFIGVADAQLIAGWTAVHPDVTVAAILSDPHHPTVSAMIEQLLQQQTTKGLLPAYWWRSNLYTLTVLLRSLIILKQEYPSTLKKLLKHTLAEKQLEGGGFSLAASFKYNSFETALALELYTHLSIDDAAAERCVKALMETQKEEGSWEGDALLRIPAPYITDPETVTEWNGTGGGNSFVEDRRGLFSTVMACYALNCWQQKIAQHLV